MPAGDARGSWDRIAAEIASRATGRATGTTSGTTHARARINTDTVMFLFIVASVPALLANAWSAGRQSLILHASGTVAGWRLSLLQALGFSATAEEPVASLVLGLVYILPLLLIAVLVGLFWAALFARMRDRPVDPGWPLVCWLYVLLLPADISLLMAALGMSFAAVIGLHIFGGTGRYIASPAALGALFVQFSYPGTGQVSSAASWAAAAVSEPALSGMPLALACVLGAALLARSGVVSLRSILGGVLGVALAGTLAGMIGESTAALLGWRAHLVLGTLPLCLAFVVTDPTTAPLTRAGRWMHGMLFGALVVAIRVLDPTHPDGSLFAVLLATLLVPLIDHCVVRRHITATRGRLELRS
jgi:Na+-transporting NADH:ubiquinone oxidoreductase subunit B